MKGMYMYSIYKYTNTANGKVYVGQTSKTLEERAQSNGRNYRESPLFYAAIMEYGWPSFIPEIIDTARTKAEADEKERHYIGCYKSNDAQFGYNITDGGRSDFTFPSATRSAISRMATERYMDARRNPMYGKHHTDESKAKMRECKLGSKNPMFGRTWTDTQREKCSTKGKKLHISDEFRRKLVERGRMLGESVSRCNVRCVEDGIVYPSETEAASAYGIAISTLNGHLKGRQKTCAGKHFVYTTD